LDVQEREGELQTQLAEVRAEFEGAEANGAAAASITRVLQERVEELEGRSDEMEAVRAELEQIVAEKEQLQARSHTDNKAALNYFCKVDG
jgi:uncharacterized coiled-coil protein SlyX